MCKLDEIFARLWWGFRLMSVVVVMLKLEVKKKQNICFDCEGMDMVTIMIMIGIE